MFEGFRQRKVVFKKSRDVVREALSAADFDRVRQKVAQDLRDDDGTRDEREREKKRKRETTTRSVTTRAKIKRRTFSLSLVSTKREREKERATRPRDLSEEAASPGKEKEQKKNEITHTDKTARAGDANL